MIERRLQDLRYAARTFRRSPGFLLLTVLTIAVGVGANAAIFSVVNAVLVRPLPFPRPNDLVLVTDTNRQTRQSNGDTSPANFLDWRVRHHSFTGLAAFRQARFTFSSADRPESVPGAIVNVNFFGVLDIKPALGRGFNAADEEPGAPRVAIIADGFWRQRFGGRTDAIGRPSCCSSRLSACSSSSPRGTCPGCSLPARRGGARRWQSASRSARAAGGFSASS